MMLVLLLLYCLIVRLIRTKYKKAAILKKKLMRMRSIGCSTFGCGKKK